MEDIPEAKNAFIYLTYTVLKKFILIFLENI